jgi:hypothetical protein
MERTSFLATENMSAGTSPYEWFATKASLATLPLRERIGL